MSIICKICLAAVAYTAAVFYIIPKQLHKQFANKTMSIENFYYQSINTNYQLSTNIIPTTFCDSNSQISVSGYFGVTGSKFDIDKEKHYFYYFAEKRSTSLLPKPEEELLFTKPDQATDNDKPVPLLIWLNGGPGCSSLLGLFTENGPCLINKDGSATTTNLYSWTEAAHVLYLDQPTLTGYSYTSKPKSYMGGKDDEKDDDMVAEDAYYFLQSFFNSELGKKYKDLPVYLTGESYAGHYIPAIAHRIKLGNQDAKKKNHIHIPLSGLAIGNGFYDLETQLKSFPEMAYKNSHGIKLVTQEEYTSMTASAKSCSSDAHKCKTEMNPLVKQITCQKASNCEETLIDVLTNNGRNHSIYDITKPCFGEGCTDDIDVPTSRFLNLNKTKETLGVPPSVNWSLCNDHVSRVWSYNDRGESFAPFISELLNDELPVLLYAGDLDYICNYIGVHAIANKLDWKYGNEFRQSKDHDWNNGGGVARSSNGLSFLQLHNAGHMVPSDQPEQALKMIRQFLNGEVF